MTAGICSQINFAGHSFGEIVYGKFHICLIGESDMHQGRPSGLVIDSASVLFKAQLREHFLGIGNVLMILFKPKIKR